MFLSFHRMFIKSNNSFKAKDYKNRTRIAVSSKNANEDGIVFSLQRDGIKVHHTERGILNLVRRNPPDDDR